MSYQEQTTPGQTIAAERDETLATRGLLQTAAADARLAKFIDLAKAGGLEPLLGGPDLFTVLAPVNEAFASGDRSPDRAGDCVIRGAITADQLRASGSAKALSGRPLQITGDSETIRINGARVLSADIECTNGVIHIVDRLL